MNFSLQTPEVLTTSHGHPIDDKQAVQTVGPRGPMLMQDFMYMDEMAHFDRERIPERVVHAKGAGMQKVSWAQNFYFSFTCM